MQIIPFLLPIIAFPLLFITRSKYLNTFFNYSFYLPFYFLPFLLLFFLANLLLLPITFCFILYSILKGNYTNTNHQTVKISTSTKVIHFLSFFVFGMLFLVYKLLADLVYVIGKTRKVPKKKNVYLFDNRLYSVLKQTCLYFMHRQQTEVHWKVMGNKFIEIYQNKKVLDTIVDESEDEQDVRVEAIVKKLDMFAQGGNIHITHFIQIINQIKYKDTKDKKSHLRKAKLQQLEIFFQGFNPQQNR